LGVLRGMTPWGDFVDDKVLEKICGCTANTVAKE
jgi:hypothetical protein